MINLQKKYKSVDETKGAFSVSLESYIDSSPVNELESTPTAQFNLIPLVTRKLSCLTHNHLLSELIMPYLTTVSLYQNCFWKFLLIANFIVSRCTFCKLQRNFGFFCSINHRSRPLRNTFTCDWCISIQFVCFCVSRFVACDHPVLGHNRLVFFEDFFDPSYSCLLPSIKSPLIITISFIVSFAFVGQAGRMRCIVICINSVPTQMIDGTKNTIWSLQMCSAIQQIWL